MKETITIFQKPTCSKCRAAISLLKERGETFRAVNYYEQPFTAGQLGGVLKKLKLSPRDILRHDEPIARELGINQRKLTDDELIELMVKHPDLIQRPIVVKGQEAVLARPTENLEQLLK